MSSGTHSIRPFLVHKDVSAHPAAIITPTARAKISVHTPSSLKHWLTVNFLLRGKTQSNRLFDAMSYHPYAPFEKVCRRFAFTMFTTSPWLRNPNMDSISFVRSFAPLSSSGPEFGNQGPNGFASASSWRGRPRRLNDPTKR
jgi:hypothetical protein